MGLYGSPFSSFTRCKQMQFPWRHGEPLSGLHGYYSSEQTLWLVESHVELGCCACGWRQTGGGGGRGAQNQFDKRFNHMDECWARRTLLAVSLTHRHTDWLICSLTHLVNWYVSHFKSYIHNDMFCISHYSCLWGSNVRGERSKQSVCRVGSCVTSKLSAPAICVCKFPSKCRRQTDAQRSDGEIYDHCVLTPPSTHFVQFAEAWTLCLRNCLLPVLWDHRLL